MSLKVYIEQADGHYANMWRRWGYEITRDYMDADIIQFTGGEDVNPAYYDEVPHRSTGFNSRRDEFCYGIFKYATQHHIPMTGICRGGQFLNVANGGKMFQHCDGHAIYGTHKATILETGVEVDVTSTHHQIMRPNRDKGIILMEANPKLGTFKEHMVYDEDEWIIVNNHIQGDDIEAVFYPDTMSLCYQPHPEWCEEKSSCVQAYKYFLRNHLGLRV